MSHSVIVCQQWTEMVTDYLEDALPRGLRRAVERHLATCSHCVEYLAQVRRTIAAMGSIPADDVPDDVIDVFQRAFEHYHAPDQHRPDQ